jgi:hypothetical protein
MNIKRYMSILKFADIELGEARKLWQYLGDLSDLQIAMVINKQKRLIKNGKCASQLSASENGIAYLLRSLKAFHDRTNSSDEYINLTREEKLEFVEFDSAKLELKKAPIKKRVRKKRAASGENIVSSNIFRIYSMYANGYTWEAIAEHLNDIYKAGISREVLIKYFRRLAAENLPPLKPKRNSKSAVAAKSAVNSFAKALKQSFLDKNLAYIQKRKGAGIAYRKIADELTKKHNVEISYMDVYRCHKSSLKA